MPENVKSEAVSFQAIGSDAVSTSRIGSESFASTPIGSYTTAEVLTPRTLVVVGVAFTSWSQTDIVFGGTAMDTPFSGLT